MRDVFFLTSGQLRAPALTVAPPGAARRTFAPTILSVTVAVVLRKSGEVVLVDAGWSEDVCADPQGHLGRFQAAKVGMFAQPGESVSTQLRYLGIAPTSVTTIIATHLHLDHVGGAADFPNAEVITTDRELAAYRTFGRGAGYRAEDLARAGRIRVVSLSERTTYGFPASHDLFGDGKVVLLDARGHTRGSMACALRTAERNYVHVGDAVYASWEYGLSPRGPSLTAKVTAWSRDELMKTYGYLRAAEADARRPLIVPSHDVAVFERLPHAPHAATANRGAAPTAGPSEAP